MPLAGYLADKKKLIEQYLDGYLPKNQEFPAEIHQAMRYSLFASGKRLRPILALAACEAVGGEIKSVLPLACSLELIHTYSLIHDDLPAMDNDDFRRGQPSNHKKFGEAIAILAGDALLTQAFALLSIPTDLSAALQLQIIQEAAAAAGSMGLIGGQVLDIQTSGNINRVFGQMDAPLLEYIHTHKTGVLFRAAVRIGAIAGKAAPEQLSAITGYGDKIGLAFQITDDILDLECTTQELGKPQGSDMAAHKLTYPAVWGIQAAREQSQLLLEKACRDLDIFAGKAVVLKDIAGYLLNRRE
ncbi:MAG: polyprenyl synthetase family protein [Candidatus Schekmanbacteria bacterium]|nr:polyprenyl synthetase family protein [Candidatus Schekmanbacteria bacterium]